MLKASLSSNCNSPETDHSAVCFIPETKSECFKRSSDINDFYFAEDVVFIMTTLQVVIRNPGAQMMYMMKANVAGEPVKDCRQLQERASFYCSCFIVPFFSSFPGCIFVLMLHVKEPQTSTMRNQKNWNLN